MANQGSIELVNALLPAQSVSQVENYNDQLQGVTFGQRASRGERTFKGDGTFANYDTNPNLFSTKKDVILNPDWAGGLNQLLANSQSAVSAAANQGATDFSVGLFGQDLVTGAPRYYTSIQQYYPDDRARLGISKIDDPNVPPYLLPGSTAQRAAKAAGLSIGLVRVKNPGNQTGYLAVGSKGWRDAFAKFANQQLASTQFDMQHLLGQGGVYGLGPVFALNNVDVRAEPTVQGGPVRYYVPGASPIPGVEGRTIRVTPIEAILQNGRFWRSVQAYYDANLKDADASRKGKYGAASLLLRHANKMNTTDTGLGADQAAVEQAVIDQFAATGSAAGIAHWANVDGVNYSDNKNRLGLTAFPLRDANGNPIAPGQSIDPRAGECNFGGSGPQISQSARRGGDYNFRYYKLGRKHTSTRKGKQGMRTNNTTYYCGSTPDYVINPDRQIYQAGGSRALANQSLDGLLTQIGDPNYTTQGLRDEYLNWALNPQAYGTNPNYMLNPAEGRLGFARWAPVYAQQAIARNYGPAAATAYANVNLIRLDKEQQSTSDFDNAQRRYQALAQAKGSRTSAGLTRR